MVTCGFCNKNEIHYLVTGRDGRFRCEECRQKKFPFEVPGFEGQVNGNQVLHIQEGLVFRMNEYGLSVEIESVHQRFLIKTEIQQLQDWISSQLSAIKIRDRANPGQYQVLGRTFDDLLEKQGGMIGLKRVPQEVGSFALLSPRDEPGRQALFEVVGRDIKQSWTHLKLARDGGEV